MTTSRTRRAAALGALSLASIMVAPAMAQDCEVKIGVAVPLTGGASAWGLAIKAGADFMTLQTNEAGGLQMANGKKCKVKVVSIDAQCSAAGGAAASNYFASENIKVILGPVCSPETTGLQPVSIRHGQLYMSTSYKKDVIGPEWPLGFHLYVGPLAFGPILIEKGMAQFKFKKAVLMGPNDQGGTDAGNQFLGMYKSAGVTIAPEWYQRGTTNFAPLVARVMAQNPDLVELAAMPPPDVTIFVKQMTEAGYTGNYGALGGIGLDPVVNGAGSLDKIKGYFWIELIPVDDPGAVRMREDYLKAMKSPPPANAIFHSGVIGMEQYLRAIADAGTASDSEKVAASLRKLTPESKYLGKGGWRGRKQYGINQELAFPIGMGVVVNGKKIGVQRIEIPSEQ